MFGQPGGAHAAITGNTFAAVTLLWMGRVKRGGKSSQVHRKVMIQTVYNRISRSLSLHSLSVLSHPLFSLLPSSLRSSLFLSLSSLPTFTRVPTGPSSPCNEHTFMTRDAVAGRVRWSIRIRTRSAAWFSFKYRAKRGRAFNETSSKVVEDTKWPEIDPQSFPSNFP